MLLSALATVFAAALTFTAAPAVAAEPEAPSTSAASSVGNSSADLHGIVNPGAASEEVQYTFAFKAGSECTGGSLVPRPPASVEGNAVEVSAVAKGLMPGTTYSFCLVALHPAEEEGEPAEEVVGDSETFTTSADPPTVSEELATDVGVAEATVRAQVDSGGVATKVKVEYGTGAPLKVSPEISLGAAEGPAGVLANLTGLDPGAVYHYRFVASNALGSVAGAEESFTTAPAGGGFVTGLPDGRVLELVSPVDSQEVYVPEPGTRGGIDVSSARPARASADGEAFVYIGEPPSSGEGGSGSTGQGSGNQYIARRSSSGWTPDNITPSAGNPLATEYEAFSDDLALGVIVSPNSNTFAPLAPGVPFNCRVLYSRLNEGPFEPLFTSTQTPGFCGEERNLRYAGASADRSRLFFQTSAALIPGVEEAEGEGKANLYESVAGSVRSVNILNNEVIPNATYGAASDGESDPPNFHNAISEDGARVVWTDLNSGNIYVRQSGVDTIPVSLGAATFWTATPDGRYDFYTENGALWRFDGQTETRSELAAEGVLGVIGTNEVGEDGEYVYFVSTSMLSADENSRHESAVDGSPNLYVRRGATTSFVATLSPEDNDIPGILSLGDWHLGIGTRTAEVTADGRHVGFLSFRHLTGYESTEPGLRPITELFVYDANSRSLSCASCDPRNAPPIGIERPNSFETSGAYVPISFGSIYGQRWLSSDGSRAFFDTPQPLVPQDTNKLQDVYEWEQDGYRGCGNIGGCVSVLSGGTEDNVSYLIDADTDGGDVFFATRSRLLPRDRDERVSLYDAREGGGFPEVSLACTGTGCQGVPPAPPVFATPPSVTFSGTGNFVSSPLAKAATPRKESRAERLVEALKSCRDHARHNRRKRKACEVKARRRYGPSHVGASSSRHQTGKRSKSNDANSRRSN